MRAEDRKAGQISPALLRAYGESIYGERWQSPLARDLGVDQTQVRDWLWGRRPIPERWAVEIVEVVAAKSVERFVGEIARRCEADGRMPAVLTFRPPPGPAEGLAIAMLKSVWAPPGTRIEIAIPAKELD